MASPRTVPRPILKSSSSFSSSSSSSSSKSSPLAVQFSPCLSTTFLTHASTYYNRSPIQVDVNECALPQRGYTSDDDKDNEQWDLDLESYITMSDPSTRIPANDSRPCRSDTMAQLWQDPRFEGQSLIPDTQTIHNASSELLHTTHQPSQTHWSCLGGF